MLQPKNDGARWRSRLQINIRKNKINGNIHVGNTSQQYVRSGG